MYTFTNPGDSAGYRLRNAVIEYITEHAENMLDSNFKWKIFCIDDKHFLINTVGDENIMFCSWVSFDALMIPVKAWK